MYYYLRLVVLFAHRYIVSRIAIKQFYLVLIICLHIVKELKDSYLTIIILFNINQLFAHS